MRPAIACVLVLGLLGGCAVAPAETFAAGQQVAFDGRVVSVDTTPWAYDGNAVVVVRSDAGRDVRVQLPARWHLCKAPSADAQALAAGDRVHVVASANEADSVTVCERAEHRLARMGG